jgi:hypothetical protein
MLDTDIERTEHGSQLIFTIFGCDRRNMALFVLLLIRKSVLLRASGWLPDPS